MDYMCGTTSLTPYCLLHLSRAQFEIEGAIEEVIYLLVAITLAFLMAIASYHLWEQPFLRLKRHFTIRRALPEAGSNTSHLSASPRKLQINDARQAGIPGSNNCAELHQR